MIQIENEYGSYGTGNQWPSYLKFMWQSTGVVQVPFYTADGPSTTMLAVGYVEGAAKGLNPGINDQAWNLVRDKYPHIPALSSETYSGWLTHWSEEWQGKSTQAVINELTYLLKNGHSFSIYMAHGGTNFGFWSGANGDGTKTYQPDITSYDYDAPINEQGSGTDKFNAIRQLIMSFVKYPVPAPPAPIPVMEVADFVPEYYCHIFDVVAKTTPLSSESIQFQEQFDQQFGLTVYSNAIDARLVDLENTIDIIDLHDYANVYINQTYQRSLYRGKNQHSFYFISKILSLNLDILVENMGRINFSHGMNNER